MIDTSGFCKTTRHDFVELTPSGGFIDPIFQCNPQIYCRQCGEVRGIPREITYHPERDPLATTRSKENQ